MVFTYTINDNDNTPSVKFGSPGYSGDESVSLVGVPVELSGISSLDVTVDGAFTYHQDPWEAGVWQEVFIPIEAFESVDGQSDLLFRSSTDTETAGFWLDDVALVVATTPVGESLNR